MDDRELVQRLLERQESDDLDFKSEQYRFDSDRQTSEFIKDIVAMANTPRSEPAYILLGIREEKGKVVESPGVDSHHDGANLGGIIERKVDRRPQFNYRQVPYQEVEIGLIEIPADQPRPIALRFDYGVLREGAVYFRKNTANVVATGDDLARITLANADGPISETSMSSGAWDQLYRACDGFDPGRIFVALMDRVLDVATRDWTALAGVHWSLVVDFDIETDTIGNYSAAKDPFGERQSLRLTALDDSPEITPRSTLWVAAAGLKSRPTTKPSSNRRDWNRHKVPQIEQVLNKLAQTTEPRPITVVIFGGDASYIRTVSEIADRAFDSRVEYVIAVPDPGAYGNIMDEFEASTIPISMLDVAHGLRDSLPNSGEPGETLFPRSEGGTVQIEPSRASWMDEELELIHLKIESNADIQSNGELFLKGAMISWGDLNSRMDVDRAVTNQLEQDVRKELDARATRRINLWHWPGAGASTLARRIAWDVHREFPTVVAREIKPQETAERVRYLFGSTGKPILVIIDLPHATKEVVDRFYDVLRGYNVPAVLFNVERRFGLNDSTGQHYLDAMLETWEAARLKDLLASRVPERRSDLESLVVEQDRRKRTPFYFGLTAYGNDFKGIESYVEARLTQASDPVRQAMLYAAFAYYYGQVSLPLEFLNPVFGLSASKRIYMRDVFPEYVRELLIEESERIRPSHQLIAEEILQQELSRKEGDKRNWPNGLADLATSFIELATSLPHRDGGIISNILRFVLIERGSGESPAGPWESEFSRFLTDVPSMDGQQRVLVELTRAFPAEPHFWAHLGRFYSRRPHDHANAHSAYQVAIDLLPQDALLHHMAAMGRRAELYDSLSSIGNSLSRDDENKILAIVNEATMEFETARSLDRRSEYPYISQVQMIHRVVGTISTAKGYQFETMRFLTLSGNDAYRELVDEAQNLLSDLDLIKSGESPSQLQAGLQARLEEFHGNHSEAIERLTNVLDRRDSHKPPIRRAIIRAYVGRHQGNWNRLGDNEMKRVVELATANVDEEPASDYNLRHWLRAVRVENALSVDRVAERLTYKRIQNPSVDTAYYLYIMKFLQLESGDLAATDEVRKFMHECGNLAQDLPRTTSPFEWLGNAPGLAALVHVSSLEPWDSEKAFWSDDTKLRMIRGRIAQIRNLGNGEIELPSGLRAFFVPSRGQVAGGYLVGQDIGREVEFYLGFSYDGLRAWSVHDPQT